MYTTLVNSSIYGITTNTHVEMNNNLIAIRAPKKMTGKMLLRT